MQPQYTEQSPPFWQRHRKGIIIISVLFLVFAAGGFFLYNSAEKMLEDRFLQAIDEPLGPDREWVYDDIDVGIFPPRLTIYGLKIRNLVPFEDQRLEREADAVRDFRAEQIEVKSVGFGDLIRSAELHIGSVMVHSPEIAVLFRPTTDIDFQNGGDQVLEKITVSELEIINGNIDVFAYRADQESVADIKGMNLFIDDFTYQDSNRLLRDWAPYFSVQLESLSAKFPDETYQVKIGQTSYDSNDQKLRINNGKLMPLLSPQELPEKIGEEVDHFDIESGAIEIHGVDADSWIESRLLHADYATLDSLQLRISRDKNYPDKERTKRPLPAVMLKNFPYSVALDSIRWTNGLISYRQWKEGQDQYGEVTFNEIDLAMKNIQNRDESEPVTAVAKTKLMDKSDFEVDFSFMMDDSGKHDISGRLSSMDLTAFNSVFSPLAFMKIQDDAVLDYLEFDFRANDEKATGNVTMIYDGLSVRKLNEDTLEESTSTRLVSFVANLTSVRSDNDEDDPRIGEIDLERDKERSMFTYWWHTLREGLKESVGM